jgi:hypothetical protein
MTTEREGDSLCSELEREIGQLILREYEQLLSQPDAADTIHIYHIAVGWQKVPVLLRKPLDTYGEYVSALVHWNSRLWLITVHTTHPSHPGSAKPIARFSRKLMLASPCWLSSLLENAPFTRDELCKALGITVTPTP